MKMRRTEIQFGVDGYIEKQLCQNGRYNHQTLWLGSLLQLEVQDAKKDIVAIY